MRGYDEWKLEGPLEPTGPMCDCGASGDIRVLWTDPRSGRPEMCCEDCFAEHHASDTGPCFDDLESAEEYAQAQIDDAADAALQRGKDDAD